MSLLRKENEDEKSDLVDIGEIDEQSCVNMEGTIDENKHCKVPVKKIQELVTERETD